MKRFLILLLATGGLLRSATGQSAETAQARLFCLSLQFQEGTTYGGTLDLSSISGTPNGELLPTFGDTSGNPWSSAFVLTYGGLGTIDGVMQVNLPPAVDANNDGFNDFFEVSQGVTTTVTSGSYNTGYSTGTITATWSRTAGSPNGTCLLDLVDDTFGDLGTYTCPFTLLEYTGPLTYTPGSNTVSAAIALTQTGNSANTLQGPIVFIKSTSDRFDVLTNQPGVWTNAASQALSFTNEVFIRNIPSWPTNYAGYVYFADGNPSTAAPDYQLWVLSIDDSNDANDNGIPDFSDDPSTVTPPRAPLLSIALGATNVLITISGDVGHTDQIQEIGSLTSTNWQTALSFLQTNDPQVVSLPLPVNTPEFWRAAAQ
ncbi:MAG TPA: hypothetical protein VMA13_04040 [Candidatus Saccharimonadales bacterium]|nr:hypothetical protein [Candidatus Saccharimonadales bacterium]